ncbi:hypothetical protein [Labedaea rhizosphaerae]|uniref:hypothetical protein n=1 Tax=Labedaea rhizosphaerae TaxID=598644 RepID=UPI00105B2C63|nr:hypothetical protein [Labedaea rhizosphaerae]
MATLLSFAALLIPETASASTAAGSLKALPDCNSWFGEYIGVSDSGGEAIVSINYSGLSRWLGGNPGLVYYTFSDGKESKAYNAAPGGGQHGVNYLIEQSGRWVATVKNVWGKDVCDEYIQVITQR